uniref:Uncharacterized protein n=1 Tax=Polytomella parva TaxID=51329 RepID=A0A7S0YK41_9CHLO
MNYYSPPSTDFVPNPSLIGGDPSRLGTGARLLSTASGVRRQGDRQSHIPPGTKGMGGAEMMSMGPGQMTNVSMVPGSMPSQRTPALVDEGSGMHLNGNMQPLFMHSDGQFFGYGA